MYNPNPVKTEKRLLYPTLLGAGMGGAPGEGSVPTGEGITGAASGVWAGVLGSLLLISPADAEPEPTFTPTPVRAWHTHKVPSAEFTIAV